MGRRQRGRLRRATEALPGGRSFNELRDVVTPAVQEKFGSNLDGRWVWIRDMSDTWAVVEVEGTGIPEPGYHQVTYSIDDDGTVTLGEPQKVEARTTYQVTESTIPGRLVEAKGTDDNTGARVFGFRIVEGGQVGRNRRRYPEAVLTSAVSLYEGSKCFDRHRTEAELRSSTIAGLVGSWSNVRAVEGGIDADLHLLPSATHTAEALDASLTSQAAGGSALVGASHDVLGRFRVVIENGQRIEEATEIAQVNSVDVVADPAAGGRVTRMVAGGIETTQPEPEGDTMTFEELEKLINGATQEQKASLATLLGPTATPATPAATVPADKATTTTDKVTTDPVTAVTPADTPEPVLVGAAESIYARDSIFGRQLVRSAATDAKLPERTLEAVTPLLPERFTEAQLTDFLGKLAPALERQGLVPTVPDASVGKEDRDCKVEALDAMFAGDFRTGYRSVKEAFIDVTGVDTRKWSGPASQDFNRHVLRESMLVMRDGVPGFYDASRRATESVDSVTWAELFGDALHKRMIAEYGLMALTAWRQIVSSIVPVPDFRTQKPQRMGGYGLLPIVPERAPYQPLTTPPDEQVPWDVDKRGGTEDWTLEAVANDDLRALLRIPQALGRAAALTLYRFVFDMIRTNPTMVYDSTALFAAGHANTDNPAALSQSALSTGRRKMRQQTVFGNSVDILGAVPKFLIVPSALEETAFQLVTSAVAITSNADATIPNIHQGMTPIVVDYLSDQDDWYIVGDPATVPTIEIGFYQGREDPELFTQSDPTQGSVFDADVFKIKIRHVYGGTVLDHRGFYRGQGS